MKTIDLVIVVWRDAHSVSDGWMWLDVPADPEPLMVTTVGWLIDKRHGGKRGHVSLAQSVTDHRAIDSILHIPKGMVEKIIPLAEGRFENGRFVPVPQRD